MPALPLLCWAAAVVGWLVMVVQAVIAAPVWLVGHCMPEGEGFAGVSGRAGYALFLSVLLRPVLLVISFFVCMMLLNATGSFIYELLNPYLASTRQIGPFGNFGPTAAFCFLLVLGTLISLMTWKMFELMTKMPDQIIRWAGQLLANLGDEGAGLAGQAKGEASAGFAKGAEGVGNAIKGIGDNKKKRQVGQNDARREDSRDQAQADNAPHEAKSIPPHDRT